MHPIVKKMIMTIMLWAGFASNISGCTREESKKSSFEELAIFNEEYPRVFQFRVSEGTLQRQKNITYEEWSALFKEYDGIMGKVLDEELVRSNTPGIEYFTRFKKEHPEKLVMLHYNGQAQRVVYNLGKYFAGHWLYYDGCTALEDIPLTWDDTEIKVENPDKFRMNIGRYPGYNDHIVLCAVGENGKPDWNTAEQATILSIDRQNKVIKIKRGCFGTQPLAFKAGKVYIAAHAASGPWERNGDLLWMYNLSLDCPRDANGKNYADIFLDELGNLFNQGGALEWFDGIEFDVMLNRPPLRDKPRGSAGIDTNGDGMADGGLTGDGDENRFTIGVHDFLQRLRERLGDDKFIMADGMSSGHQRGFGILNGIESEGWPTLTDIDANDWSGGLNRHYFWNANGYPYPKVFNYINHKFRKNFITEAGVEGKIPFNVHRLVFAVAQFTDAAITYADMPDARNGEKLPIWDELVMGAENRQKWLGMPLGDVVQIAKSTTDLLDGEGINITGQFVSQISGEHISVTEKDNRLEIQSNRTEKNSGPIVFRIKNIHTIAEDITLFFKASAQSMSGYSDHYARTIWVRAVDSQGKTLGRHMTFVNMSDFESAFYFRNIQTPIIDIEFEIEGNEMVCLSNITIHQGVDAICREFENGVVIANPSEHEYTFDLETLFPGIRLRKFQGTDLQDPTTNDGKAVGQEITLGPKDALFLVKD